MKAIAAPFWSLAFIPNRSALHQASTQPCYLLPTLSPGCSPGAHLSWVSSRPCQPAPADRPGHPPAPDPPSTPHCPAGTPSVSGCAGAFIPTSGLTPAIPHPAAAPRSAASQDPPTLQVVTLASIQTQLKKQTKNRDIFKSNLYLITEEPRSVFPWTLTDCVRATSTPRPSMFLSQWHNNRGTWPKAPTGESPLGINENPAELRNDPVFFIFPPICLSATLPGMGYVNLATFLSFCRDLSVDAGLPHHQYQLQQLPQHYQHYLASPRMHHFPRNTSSAQVVCWSLPQVALDSLIVYIPAVI